MRRHGIILAVCAIGWLPCAQGAEYTNIKPLLLQAIDEPGGNVTGVLVGPVAEKFRGSTGSSQPVLAEVTTIKSFTQDGCKRLTVRLSQGKVPIKGGKTSDLAINYDLNLCRDGSPPTEGMDIGKVGHVRGNVVE